MTADGALELPLPVPLLDELAEPEESSEEVLDELVAPDESSEELLESSALGVAAESSELVDRPDEDVEPEPSDDEPGPDGDVIPAVAWVLLEADVVEPIEPS